MRISDIIPTVKYIGVGSSDYNLDKRTLTKLLNADRGIERHEESSFTVCPSAENFLQKAFNSSNVEVRSQWMDLEKNEKFIDTYDVEQEFKKNDDNDNAVKYNVRDLTHCELIYKNIDGSSKYSDAEYSNTVYDKLAMTDIILPPIATGRELKYSKTESNSKLMQCETEKEIFDNRIQNHPTNTAVDDVDDDDHSMSDLSHDYIKLDHIKEYESPPASRSLRLPYKPAYVCFPRGIVNPNYPGFQHLAYTLSENFVGQNNSSNSNSLLEDYDDSDVTDFDMDLSEDSFENVLNEQESDIKLDEEQFNGKLIERLTTGIYQKQKLEELEEENGEFENIIKDNFCVNATVLKKSSTEILDIDGNDLLHKNDGCGDLESTQREVQFTESATRHFDTSRSCCISCITPDILIDENQHKQNRRESQPKQRHDDETTIQATDSRPDLIRGVSPTYYNSTKVIQNGYVSQQTSAASIIHIQAAKNQQNLNTENINYCYRSELNNSLDTSPVDIIGDFGQEVEREFGLLVTGYKSIKEKKVEKDLTKLVADNEKHYLSSKLLAKISDATLTYIGDKIDLKKYEEETSQRSTLEQKPATFSHTKGLDDQERSGNGQGRTIHRRIQYRKTSYDERQLPPVTIEYKKVQSRKRVGGIESTKEGNPNNKTSEREHLTNIKILSGNTIKCNNNSKNVNTNYSKKKSALNKNRHTALGTIEQNYLKHAEEYAETNNNQLYQSCQWMSDKEEILSNSKYCQREPTWSQYLKRNADSSEDLEYPCRHDNKTSDNEVISINLLELFEAYKIGTETIDQDALQQHLQMAKEIEKKGIQRLFKKITNKGLEVTTKTRSSKSLLRSPKSTSYLAIWGQRKTPYFSWKLFCSTKTPASQEIELKLFKKEIFYTIGKDIPDILDKFDSVTNPPERRNEREEIHRRLVLGSDDTPNESNPMVSLRSSTLEGDNCSDTEANSSDSETCVSLRRSKQLCTAQNAQSTRRSSPLSNDSEQGSKFLNVDDNLESDFFTKQAKIQIETRMALSQAKTIAKMHMEIERVNKRLSPITILVRESLESIGIQPSAGTRRMSRQMLTDLNIAQLQILVNQMHNHIEDLNEVLVKHLMDRDELHLHQDSMLAHIEELTHYIATKESKADQNRLSASAECAIK